MSVASLAASKPDAQDREPFVAFVSDEVTTETLLPIVGEHGWDPERVQAGGIANAVRALTIMTSPEFLIVDLSDSENPRADINALAEVCEPGTVVLALGKVNDVTLYRDLINSGIHDYLVKPVAPEVLREAIANAESVLLEPIEGQDGKPATSRLAAVVGVRGGVGASTITSSCAWIMANELDRQVAVLDLDIHFGTNALTFDLEPGRGLCDALENPSRVDGLFIERAMIKVNDKLAILGAEAPVSEPLMPDPTALNHLETELRQNFECVVMDLPRAMVANHPYLLSDASDIFIVTDLSLAATRDTIRLLAFVNNAAPEANVYLVANRVPGANQVEVSAKDFEASVERKIDWLIPLDAKTAIETSKKGKTMAQAAGRSKPVKVLREIARTIAGVKDGTKKSPLWGKLANRKAK